MPCRLRIFHRPKECAPEGRPFLVLVTPETRTRDAHAFISYDDLHQVIHDIADASRSALREEPGFGHPPATAEVFMAHGDWHYGVPSLPWLSPAFATETDAERAAIRAGFRVEHRQPTAPYTT